MLILSREDLLNNIKQLQRRSCAYDILSMGSNFHTETPPPPFCDCKYGASKRGEQTGCPELRNTALLLNNMTDAEYNEITERSKNNIKI